MRNALPGLIQKLWRIDTYEPQRKTELLDVTSMLVVHVHADVYVNLAPRI